MDYIIGSKKGWLREVKLHTCNVLLVQLCVSFKNDSIIPFNMKCGHEMLHLNEDTSCSWNDGSEVKENILAEVLGDQSPFIVSSSTGATTTNGKSEGSFNAKISITLSLLFCLLLLPHMHGEWGWSSPIACPPNLYSG